MATIVRNENTGSVTTPETGKLGIFGDADTNTLKVINSAGVIATISTGSGGGSGGTVRALHDTRFSPVGLWQLNGSGSDKLADSSGNGHNLIIDAGAELSAPGYVAGTTCWHFNDGTRLAQTGSVFNQESELTIMWLMSAIGDESGFANPINYGDNQGGSNQYYTVVLENEAAKYIDAGIKSGGTTRWTSTDGDTSRAETFSVGRTEWHHYVLAKPNDTTINLYVDGVRIFSGSNMTAVASEPATLQFNIGGAGGASFPNFLRGNIASVCWISGTLTSEQIATEASRILGR